MPEPSALIPQKTATIQEPKFSMKMMLAFLMILLIGRKTNLTEIRYSITVNDKIRAKEKINEFLFSPSVVKLKRSENCEKIEA